MKLISIFLIAFLFVFNAISIVDAEIKSNGTRLLRGCSNVHSDNKNLNSDTFADGVHCIGMIYGLITLNNVYSNEFPENKLLFCPPDIQTDQAIRVVKKYLTDHPEKLHENDVFLAISALGEAFPCKNN